MVTQAMRRQGLAVLALTGGLAACSGLEVSNPNAPERERAFSDPATIVASAGGTMRTFWNLRYNQSPTLTLSTISDSYSFSWNNFNSRFYSSSGQECPQRCGWVNSTSTALGDQVQPYWFSTYSAISSANDALFAVRLSSDKDAIKLAMAGNAAPAEAIAQFAQAAGHAWIALNYDKGFIVLEDTDVENVEFTLRGPIRDKAMELFEKGIQFAKANSFSTGGTWFGVINGPVYSNLQLAKVMRTLQAELLAMFPRTAEENAQVNWAQVATLAGQGISSTTDGAPFDLTMFQDENVTFRASGQWWGSDYTTARVDTRTANLMSTTQVTPWPGGSGNPQPVVGAPAQGGTPIGGVFGIDLRLGDGTFDDGTGVDGLFGVGEKKETANKGSDFMWSPFAIFIPGRGSEHQSNIGYIRHRAIVGGFPSNPPGDGPIQLLPRAYNDLLWAEGLIRSGGSKATAAGLINNSRVGRGGLPAVSAANTTEELLKALNYEYSIELIDVIQEPYYTRRRTTKSDGSADAGAFLNLTKGSPRHMPVPAKDLALLRAEIYSFGFPNPTDLSPAFVELASRVKNVRQQAADFEKQELANRRRRPN